VQAVPAQFLQHHLAHAGDSPHGLRPLLEQAAIGIDLRGGGSPAEEAVFLDEANLGTRFRRADGGGDTRRATAADGDVIVGFETLRHQVRQLRKYCSALPMIHPTVRPRMESMATPAISWSVANNAPAMRI